MVPARPIVPRTFVLKAGMSLFVGALARIDFLEVSERRKATSDGAAPSHRLNAHLRVIRARPAVFVIFLCRRRVDPMGTMARSSTGWRRLQIHIGNTQATRDDAVQERKVAN